MREWGRTFILMLDNVPNHNDPTKYILYFLTISTDKNYRTTWIFKDHPEDIEQ